MIVLHMVVVPYGTQIISGEYIGVSHPPERLGDEAAICLIALFLGLHTERTKGRMSVLRLVAALLCVTRRDAPVHMTGCQDLYPR
jgi:hypothetical protein